MNAGIYEIVNAENGKRYVGSAVNFTNRWNEHRRKLSNGTHHNRPLQCAHNKYGQRALIFRKMIVCSRDNLITYEQIAINALQPEFNTCRVAGNLLGFRHGAETLAKMSRSHTGKKHTAEARAKISAANKGQTLNGEQLAKLRAASVGRKYSAESRAKMSASRMGNKNSLGVKATAETRAKISAGVRARMTPEFRAKLSASRLGKKRGPYNLHPTVSDLTKGD